MQVLRYSWNNDKCRFEYKNPEEHNPCKKDYVLNPATCSCRNGGYLAGNINDSVITCDEIINAVYNVSAIVSSNVFSTVPINATNTASINFADKIRI